MQKKLEYIDFLRALAILGVILVHSYNGETNLPSAMIAIIAEGKRGVQLFFLASAITLFLSFKSRNESKKDKIKNFYLRRFFRIAPLYYFGIALYLILDGVGPRYWLGNEPGISISNILANIFFVHGFNPYWMTSLVPGGWSISVEMIFYLFVPFLFSRLKNLNNAFNFFLLCVALKQLLYFFFMKNILIPEERLWKEFLYFYFPSQLPVFALGIVGYFIIIERESIKHISNNSLICFGVTLLLQFAINQNVFYGAHLIFSLLSLILIFAISRIESKWVFNPIILYIGKISFSLYLVHFAVIRFLIENKFLFSLESPILNFVFKYLTIVIVSSVVATITYNTIELPFQRVGKKFLFTKTSND